MVYYYHLVIFFSKFRKIFLNFCEFIWITQNSCDLKTPFLLGISLLNNDQKSLVTTHLTDFLSKLNRILSKIHFANVWIQAKKVLWAQNTSFFEASLLGISLLNNDQNYRVTTYLTQFLSKLSRNFVKNTFCNCFNTSQRGSLKYFKSMKLVLKIYLFFFWYITCLRRQKLKVFILFWIKSNWKQ